MWAAADPARTAILDTVNRRVANELRRSRELFIDRPGQQVLPRTAVNTTLAAGGTPSLSLRFEAQMPARGRRILGRAAHTLLCEELLDRIDDALFGAPHGRTLQAELSAAVELAEDQAALRRHIEDAGLLAFIADGGRSSPGAPATARNHWAAKKHPAPRWRFAPRTPCAPV